MTLTVTWLSRICRDTDRIGSLASRRDCTFKSFICPPAHSLGCLFGHATPGPQRCQATTTTSCGASGRKHNIVRKCLVSMGLADRGRTVVRLGFPLLLNRFSTAISALDITNIPAFPRVFRHGLHSFSTTITVRLRDALISSLFRTFPHDIASSSDKKDGENRAVHGNCGKLTGVWAVEPRPAVLANALLARGAFRERAKVHTKCGTWNRSPSRTEQPLPTVPKTSRWRRLRRNRLRHQSEGTPRSPARGDDGPPPSLPPRPDSALRRLG